MDSDIEVVQDSAGEENDIPLASGSDSGSGSGSNSPLPSIPSSHFLKRRVQVVDRASTSNPVLLLPSSSRHQSRSHESVTSTSTRNGTDFHHTSKYKFSSKLVVCDTSSSDVEFIPQPVDHGGVGSSARIAGKDLTNKLRLPHSSYGNSRASTSNLGSRSKASSSTSSQNGGGLFKSAAALLKEEVRKDKLRKRSSSSASTSSNGGSGRDASRSPAVGAGKEPQRSDDTVIDRKGKGRDSSLPPALSRYFAAGGSTNGTARQLEDEDEDVLELPPPLSSRILGSASLPDHTTAIQAKDCVNEGEDDNAIVEAVDSSPGTAFRNQLNKFKAPAKPSLTSSATGSSFRGRHASRNVPSSLFTSQRRSGSVSEAISLSTGSDSATSSTSLSTATGRKAGTSSIPTTTSTTQLAIPAPFLALIKHCPVCDAHWTITKDSKSKLSHIRKCASQRLYSHDHVNDLVERQIRIQQAEQLEENRKLHSDKTLFEGVVSRKGKEVNVVGVEKKKRGGAACPTADDIVGDQATSTITGSEAAPAQQRKAVLYTQGGSAMSQATSTQVQKELHKRIKTNQRIERGAFVPVNQLNQQHQHRQQKGVPESHQQEQGTTSRISGSGSDSAAASKTVDPGGLAEEARKRAIHDSGVGSKNWLKAAKLLKAKDKENAAAPAVIPNSSAFLSTAYIGASISSTLVSKGSAGGIKGSDNRGRLEAFSTSRFRLSQKLNGIAAARACPSGTDGAQNSGGDGSLHILADQSNGRPYQNPSNLDISLLDKAIDRGTEKIEKGYDAWRLAGSDEDLIKDRMVSSASPPCLFPSLSPPPNRFSPSPVELSSDNEFDLPPPLAHMIPRLKSTNCSRDCTPILSGLDDDFMNRNTGAQRSSSSPRDLPPIDNLSLNSRPASPLHQLFDTLHISPETSSSILDTLHMPTGDVSHPHVLPIFADPEPGNKPSVTPASTTSEQQRFGGNNGLYDSSNGLFESSAALQALTQKLKSNSSAKTTAMLSFQSVKSGVQPRPSQQSKALSGTNTKSQQSPSTRQPLPLLLSLEALPSASSSLEHPIHRSFATSSTSKSTGLREQDEDLQAASMSLSNHVSNTASASDASPAKKSRGRPRKIMAVEVEVSPSAKGANSPKRKKSSLHPNSTALDSPLPEDNDNPDLPSPRRKRAVKKPVKDRRPPVTTKASTMPDYDSWSKEELQAETGKYGYKPAGTKKVLIDQLVRVWKAIHPEEDAITSSPSKAEERVPPWRARSRSPSTTDSPASPPKKSRSANKIVDNLEPASTTKAKSSKVNKVAVKESKTKSKTSPASAAVSPKSKAIAAARAKRKAAALSSGEIDSNGDPDDELSNVHANDEVREDEIDTDAEPDALKTAGERLRSAILGDERFYLRILRYEPILFDDFELISSSIGVKMSKVALRDWLDSQGIIFYYDQTTGRNAKRNGARQRHA